MLSNLAALLNELDSASMTNAFILDNSCFIITPENGSVDFGWLAVKILTAFSQLKLMKKCY